MSESILDSVKHAIGGMTSEYTVFDDDVIMHINSSFATLWEIGVGPKTGFAITDASAEWSDYVPEGPVQAMAKEYVTKKAQLYFDPPQSGTLVDVINRQLDELTFRLNVAVDPATTFD